MISYKQGNKLVLLSEKDLDIVLKWRNSSYVRDKMFDNAEIKGEEHYTWFKKNQLEGSSYHYIFIYQDIPAGYVSFNQVDLKNRKTSWGFYLGERNLPKGIAYIMGLLAFEKAFNEHNFNKIYGEVIKTNTKSRRYHLQLGFKEEAFFSEHLFRNNAFEDIIVYGFTIGMWKDSLNIVQEQLCRVFPQVFSNF